MKPFMKLQSAFLLAASIQFGFLQFATAGYEPCDEQVYQCSTTYENVCGYQNVCHQVPGHQECHTTSPHQECHTVPGHQECHIVPGNRECHQEQQCQSNPPSCHTEQECGTNALGNPICKDRQVCEDRGQDCSYREVCSGSDSQQECSDSGSTQECGLVPGEEQCYDTGSSQECSNEYQCSQQPKQTCGYETVHKTCYVPDPQPEPQPLPPYTPPAPPYHPPTPTPEPPYTPPAPPYYPPDPEPEPTPLPPPPVVVPAPTPTPVPPAPVPPVVPAPPTDPVVPGEIGSISVSDLSLNTKNNQIVSVSLKDKGQSPTYETRYFIAINNQADQRVISQFAHGDGTAKKQTIKLQKELPFNQSYAVAIKVVRTGGELVQDVTFVISKKLIKQ